MVSGSTSTVTTTNLIKTAIDLCETSAEPPLEQLTGQVVVPVVEGGAAATARHETDALVGAVAHCSAGQGGDGGGAEAAERRPRASVPHDAEQLSVQVPRCGEGWGETQGQDEDSE